jgi:hypothetical protein
MISRNESGENMSQVNIGLLFDTFDSAKPRFLNPGKKCRSVSTLSLRPERSTELTPKSQAEGIPRALVLSAVEGSGRGVEWVDSCSSSISFYSGSSSSTIALLLFSKMEKNVEVRPAGIEGN